MSRPKSNLIGQKFGRLVVLQLAGKDKWGKYVWLCMCDCGKEKIILEGHLRSGNTKSCGCLRIEKTTKRSTKHGHASVKQRHPIYPAWQSMIQRCINPNNKDYPSYGGRGIAVCKRWRKFENFLEDMGEHPGKEYSIDRIDNNKGYCKSNCRWATKKQQMRNKRDSYLITHEGKIQLLIEWAEDFNIPYKTLWDRIQKLGWSIERALTEPVRKQKKRSA